MKLLPILSIIALLSCGSSGTNVGPSSGLPRSSTIASLTTAQAATLCDWSNGRQGGYGRVVTCTDGSQQQTDPDKASCVQSIPAAGALCPTLTVADIEDCADAIGSDLCAITTAAACANFRQCAGM